MMFLSAYADIEVVIDIDSQVHRSPGARVIIVVQRDVCCTGRYSVESEGVLMLVEVVVAGNGEIAVIGVIIPVEAAFGGAAVSDIGG